MSESESTHPAIRNGQAERDESPLNSVQNTSAHPGVSTPRLPVSSDDETRQHPLDLNGPVEEYPRACAHEQIEEQAYKNPGRVALIYQNDRVSYGDVNERSNRIGHYLQRLGVGPETMVGLCLDRSADAIIALLGILKAGGAYVPLDPNLPQDRLAQMIRDARLPLIVTTSRLLGQLPASTARLICLDKDFAQHRSGKLRQGAGRGGPRERGLCLLYLRVNRST